MVGQTHGRKATGPTTNELERQGPAAPESRFAILPHRDPGGEGVIDMAGKFEVYQDKRGDFRFRLKAGNGQVIATGEGYKSKKACLNGIESIRKNAPGAALVDETT